MPMLHKEYALVIMAAGIGARFGGGVKQLKSVGPNGELIIDYSVYDAIRAGFNKIVFIIRRDIEADFREVIGDRMEKACHAMGVTVCYAFQDQNDLPAGHTCPAERQKPWGTGHAILACRDLLDCPFVVVNADDYYGRSFDQMIAYLKNLPENAEGCYCLAGYRLCNTLSDFGGVTRGLCSTDEQNRLLQVVETRNIVKTSFGAAAKTGDQLIPLDMQACISMNIWGFTPDLFPRLEKAFRRFLEAHSQDPGAEFVLPNIIDGMLQNGEISVQVLPTEERWFGMTYREDLPIVRAAFAELSGQNLYPPKLFREEAAAPEYVFI